MSPAARGKAGKGRETVDRLATQALLALQDPQVREELVKHGRAAVEAAQEWMANRRRTGASSITDRISGKISGRFGQRGLERREANLRSAVAALSTDSPTLATSLSPVTKSLDDVERLLTVAGGLPFAKRKRAHMKIDDVLDDLEAGLFDAVLEDTRPTPLED